MDPISMGITFVGLVVGIAGIIIGRKNLSNLFHSIRPRESVSVFGPKAAGKTTLIRYLHNDKLPEEHISTFGASSPVKIVYDLSGNDTYFFRSREMIDVGGEHKNQWRAIIEAQNPDGIIYIVDTHDNNEEQVGIDHIIEVYHDLRSHKLGQEFNLNTILILLNKCDIWGRSHDDREAMVARYRNNALKEQIDGLRSEFGTINIIIGCSSLTHAEFSALTNESLRKMVLSLNTGD